MHIRIHRSDGKTGHYTQDNPGRVEILVQRLDPSRLFCSGPIAIGVLNPFSVLNPDEICWIEIETEYPTLKIPLEDIDQVVRLSGREEYESQLAKQWPKWMKFRKGRKGDLLEALIELSLRSGDAIYLHVTGRVGNSNIVEQVFGTPAITATFSPNGTTYINPKTVTRARIYHSKDRINLESGFWMAEADDL